MRKLLYEYNTHTDKVTYRTACVSIYCKNFTLAFLCRWQSKVVLGHSSSSIKF